MLTFETAIGTCALRWDARGITNVYLPGDRVVATRVARGETVAADVAPALAREAARRIRTLLAGEADDLGDIAVSDAAVDPFARRVYEAARRVGPGEVTTYGEIARAIGESPAAARAVGAALGANPVPVVVPCHRVLAADGSLHGFSAPGGIDTKRRMLEIERAPGFTQQPLFA